MQNIDASDLLDFDRDLARILDDMPDDRRQLHEEIGDILKADVDAAIPASGLTEHTGDLRRWQIKQVGTGGGYAAVHAKKGNLPPNKRGIAYAYGQITNAVVSGHKARPNETAEGYRKGRIRLARIPGRDFYSLARTGSEAKVIRKVEEFTEKISAKLEGS